MRGPPALLDQLIGARSVRLQDRLGLGLEHVPRFSQQVDLPGLLDSHRVGPYILGEWLRFQGEVDVEPQSTRVRCARFSRQAKSAQPIRNGQ